MAEEIQKRNVTDVEKEAYSDGVILGVQGGKAVTYDAKEFSNKDISFGKVEQGDTNAVSGNDVFRYINEKNISIKDLHSIDLSKQNHILEIKNDDAIIFNGYDNLSTTVFCLVTAKNDSKLHFLGVNTHLKNNYLLVKKDTYYYVVITVLNKDEIIIEINEGVQKVKKVFSYGDFKNNEISNLQTGEKWIVDGEWSVKEDLAYYKGVRDIDRFLTFKTNIDTNVCVIKATFNTLDRNAGISIFRDSITNSDIVVTIAGSDDIIVIQERTNGVSNFLKSFYLNDVAVHSITIYKNKKGFSFYVNDKKMLDYMSDGSKNNNIEFGFVQGERQGTTSFISKFKSFEIITMYE